MLDNFSDLDAEKGFKIFGYNIRSLLPKFHQFSNNICDANLDIICLSETWLKPNIESGLVKLVGYSLLRCDRTTGPPANMKPGGGVCTYVRDNYTTKTIPVGTYCDDNIELLSFVVICPNCRDLVVVSTYRPPSGNCNLAITALKTLCDSICTNNKQQDIVIVGDLNIDSLSESYNKVLLSEFCYEFSFTSNITIPTRETLHSSSSIDVIISSMSHITSSGIFKNYMSDHFPTFLIKKKMPFKHPKASFQGRSYKEFDKDLFCENLRSYNWGRFYGTYDIDQAWDEMFSIISEECDNMCPSKTFYIKSDKPTWYTDDLV